MKDKRKNQKQISISIGVDALKIVNEVSRKSNRNRSNSIETIILSLKDKLRNGTLAI